MLTNASLTFNTLKVLSMSDEVRRFFEVRKREPSTRIWRSPHFSNGDVLSRVSAPGSLGYFFAVSVRSLPE